MYTFTLSALLLLSTSHIQLNGTFRLPSASGETKVETSDGSKRLFLHVSGMKPASLFGGDFNTYVLWLVSPDGRPFNAGEIVLNGDEGRLQTSTDLEQFSLLVTAEPHYAVDIPSRFVALEMPRSSDSPPFECKAKGVAYNYERDNLANAKEADGPVHTDLEQAYTAVRLAERARAATLASEELRAARQSLRTTLQLAREGKQLEAIHEQAHQTIELAVAAQRIAQKRSTASYK